MGTKSDRSGQAIIEYVLLLTIIMSISGIMVGSIKSTRDKMWKRMLCEITPACPTCKAPDTVKAILSSSGVQCKN